MKKFNLLFILVLFIILLSGCDKIYICELDVKSSNSEVNFVVDGEIVINHYQFTEKNMNRSPLDNYSNIDFTLKESYSIANVFKFEILSSSDKTYNLSLELNEANKYVIDFLRIGIVIDENVKVYKYYEDSEKIYHRENDPDSILHFKSKNEIFDELSINLKANEQKEILFFVWIEEAELYDKDGNRYTGYKDKSYDASEIYLKFEIE